MRPVLVTAFKEPVFSAEQRAGDSRKIEEAHAQYSRSIV